MKLIHITFSKISDKLIQASLSVFNDKMARHIFDIQGVSRKQCAYNFCKQGIVSWDLFSELKEMADAQADPRFCKSCEVGKYAGTYGFRGQNSGQPQGWK